MTGGAPQPPSFAPEVHKGDIPKEYRLQRYYTAADIAGHNTAHNCWVSFFGRVYDLTPLLAEYKGPLAQPIIAAAGSDISFWFDEATGQPKMHLDPVTGMQEIYYPWGRYIHVPPQGPESDWATDFGTPWWEDTRYWIGLRSAATRKIGIVNLMTRQKNTLEVPVEESKFKMEDDSPVIYGLELNARALVPQHAETDIIRFIVGTQSLKYENQIHLIDFDDESNVINKNVFMHSVGEIWSMNTSPTDKTLLATCYNEVSESKAEIHGALWRIPPVDDTEPPGLDSPGISPGSGYSRSLQLICNFDNKHENMRSVLWNPSGDGSQVVTVCEQHLDLWDLDRSASTAESIDSALLEGKGQPKFTTGRWNPHHSGSQIATANDTTIKGWDVRTMRPFYTIESAHNQLVRDLDFNPNKQYILVSCGDDCKMRFWDTRNTTDPLMVLQDHSHWVWSVRFNHFHDQLLLTSSSDSRVILNNIVSLSSEPFGHLDEEDEDEGLQDKGSREPVKDGVIATFDEHEDSVYAVEWSTADPWVFASLSYDGRLVINRVPRAEKYKILL